VDNVDSTGEPSMRWLTFTRRRLTDLPVTMGFTCGPVLSPLVNELTGPVERIRRTGLELAGRARMTGPAPDEYMPATYLAAGGNPYPATGGNPPGRDRRRHAQTSEGIELAAPAVANSLVPRLAGYGPHVVALAKAVALHCSIRPMSASPPPSPARTPRWPSASACAPRPGPPGWPHCASSTSSSWAASAWSRSRSPRCARPGPRRGPCSPCTGWTDRAGRAAVRPRAVPRRDRSRPPRRPRRRTAPTCSNASSAAAARDGRPGRHACRSPARRAVPGARPTDDAIRLAEEEVALARRGATPGPRACPARR
jgi:hypothetical protein